jgi:serine/threonine protein kinase
VPAIPEPVGEQRRSYGYYDVESVLGRGAMGMVYLARDRRIGRKVALKTVHIEEKFDDQSEANEFYRRLQREAELCGSLQHPNIVTLYEPGYENEVIAWMATEYVDGETLRDLMRKRKPLALEEALRIGEGILRGLDYAHAKGIVHRDIKPANILLTSAGEAKIADFGIARPTDSNLTAVGEMLGTPSYMSPEQVKCLAVSTRSDLFSFGSMLYEMVVGVKAFGAPDVSGILRNVVELDPKKANEVNAAVPASLAEFIHRLLAKSPDDRFESAGAALEELKKIRAEVAHAEPEGIEELKQSDAVSTLAAKGGHITSPSSTSIARGDVTPAMTPRSASATLLTHRVPRSIAATVLAVILAGALASAAAIRAQYADDPEVQIPIAQLKEFQNKALALESARAMYSSGKYEDAIAAYDDYLKRYPWSTAAAEERAEAQSAFNESKLAKGKVSVTAKRPTPKPEPKKEPAKKGFWRRVFGRT